MDGLIREFGVLRVHTIEHFGKARDTFPRGPQLPESYVQCCELRKKRERWKPSFPIRRSSGVAGQQNVQIAFPLWNRIG